MSSAAFFERQRESRRQSAWLLVLFTLMLAGMALLANLLAGTVSYLVNKGGSDWFASDHALLLTAIIFFIVGLGCLFRYLEIRHGGAALARHYGAVPVPEQDRRRQYKVFTDVAAEMAIAAGQPLPSLWVMPLERGINAFVAGGRTDDRVLVVTQGALDHLERDELQAIVAHEFGHIDNGDVPLNMRLLIALGGLLAVDQVGRIISGPDPTARFLPLAIVGTVLRGLGSVGVISAGLLRGAIGRQREYLADACAVQFTRQAEGLASALNKASEHYFGSRLSGYYADELAHLCFLPTTARRKLSAWFSVHPAIGERIRKIDPMFGKRREKRRQIDDDKRDQTASVSSTMGLQAVSIEHDIRGGGLLQTGIDSGLPDALMVMLNDSHASEAMLYAVLASYFDGRPALFFTALKQAGKAAEARTAYRISQTSPDELRQFAAQAVVYAGRDLQKNLTLQKRREILAALEKMSRLDGGHAVQEFLLLQLIADALDVQMNTASPQTSMSLPEAYGLVLSLLTEAAGHDDERHLRRYRQLLSIYSAADIAPRSAADVAIVEDLQAALAVLKQQMESVRHAFIAHAAEIVLDDAHITQAEKNLLQLLCAALDAPCPKLH